MKKYKKFVFILVGILLLISGGVGYMVYKQNVEHEKLVELLSSKEANSVYRAQIKKIDPYWHSRMGVIQSYKLDEKTVTYNPMGGAIVNLIVNDDPDLTIGIYIDENKYGQLKSDSGYDISSKLDELLENEDNK